MLAFGKQHGARQMSVLSVMAGGSCEVVSYLQCAEKCDGLRSVSIMLSSHTATARDTQ